jgi:hypothetical protein
MSEKDIFVSQLQKLVTWLYTCQLPDVQTENDIPTQDYSRSFIEWLAVRFRTKHGRRGSIKWQIGKTKEEITLALNTTPEMWILQLNAMHTCLHEVVSSGTTRLLLIEMSNSSGSHPPVQHRTYYDESGIFNIEFICDECNSGVQRSQVLHVTNVGQARTYGKIGTKCYWGGINSDGETVGPDDISDDMRMYNDEFANKYGVPSMIMCGVFGTQMQSDYFAMCDENEVPLMNVRRIHANTKSAVVNGASYKERDPVAFAMKMAVYRARLRHHFGIQQH